MRRFLPPQFRRLLPRQGSSSSSSTNSVDAFVKKYNKKYLDFDGAYGYQCMDLAQFYNKEVNKAAPLTGNAVDVIKTYPKTAYTFIANTPKGIPKKGDIMLWNEGLGPWGHIAIFLSGDVTGFKSFDQNFPIGSNCHIQQHSYYAVAGWLRKK